MPLAGYGVLAGSVIDQRAEGGTDWPQQMTLQGGLLPPGDSLRIHVAAPVQLGNRGGLITLLNPDGLKVDGVAYTQAQADAEGLSIVF